MFKNVLLISAFKNYFWRKEILNFYMENYSHFMFCVHIFLQGFNERYLGRLSNLHVSESPVIYKLLQ